MRRPNFFIIGAPKCGTTSLAAWLAEHPEIYMSPIKEPFYFSQDIGNCWRYGWKAYLKLFEEAQSHHKAIGEASTTYLFSRVAIPKIEQTFPNSRYIVMIRNPVDMAYSLHAQHVRRLNENIEDFYTAWHMATARRARRQIPPGCPDPILLDYPAWCRLGEQLERLYALVPEERVLVLVLDDMKENPRREYLRVLKFLEVPDDGRTSFPVYNPAGTLRSRSIGRLIRGLAKTVYQLRYGYGWLPGPGLGIIRKLEAWSIQRQPRSPMPENVRRELEAYLEDDIQKLERILGRTFPQWRSIKGAKG